MGHRSTEGGTEGRNYLSLSWQPSVAAKTFVVPILENYPWVLLSTLLIIHVIYNATQFVKKSSNDQVLIYYKHNLVFITVVYIVILSLQVKSLFFLYYFFLNREVQNTVNRRDTFIKTHVA